MYIEIDTYPVSGPERALGSFKAVINHSQSAYGDSEEDAIRSVMEKLYASMPEPSTEEWLEGEQDA